MRRRRRRISMMRWARGGRRNEGEEEDAYLPGRARVPFADRRAAVALGEGSSPQRLRDGVDDGLDHRRGHRAVGNIGAKLGKHLGPPRAL